MTSTDDAAGKRAPSQAGAKAGAEHVKRWKVADLLGTAREAVIEHGQEVYRLRLTANNRLILTK